jgi:hypothetical protein
MPDDVKNALLMMYSDQILEIVDNRDEFPRGDLQGAIEAIVLTLLNGNHKPALEKLLKINHRQ